MKGDGTMNVVSDEKKFEMKRKVLGLLQEISGQDKRPVREYKLALCVSSINSDIPPEKTRQMLDALAGVGYATHDYDELHGIVWRITDEGLSAASKLQEEVK